MHRVHLPGPPYPTRPEKVPRVDIATQPTTQTFHICVALCICIIGLFTLKIVSVASDHGGSHGVRLARGRGSFLPFRPSLKRRLSKMASIRWKQSKMLLAGDPRGGFLRRTRSSRCFFHEKQVDSYISTVRIGNKSIRWV